MQAMLLIQQIIQPDHQAKFWQFEGKEFRLISYNLSAQTCSCGIEQSA
jgi:sulfur carrier protein ThiS adenylyltransferase/adenylyltransferase/sulfurtransferase